MKRVDAPASYVYRSAEGRRTRLTAEQRQAREESLRQARQWWRRYVEPEDARRDCSSCGCRCCWEPHERKGTA